MTEQPVYYFPTTNSTHTPVTEPASQLAPTTCTEAEIFVLRVLDDSMEPEFHRGCMIVIDPTGRATEGSYVLARQPQPVAKGEQVSNGVDDFVFRQLCRTPKGAWTLQVLNPRLSVEPVLVTLTDIVGVIVQRAGTRRRYHKRYD